MKSFCQPSLTQVMVHKGVTYTCEMNDEDHVTKLAIVGTEPNHRYLPHSGIVAGIYDMLNMRSGDAFGITDLTKLKSLTHLYRVFKLDASKILGLPTVIRYRNISGNYS